MGDIYSGFDTVTIYLAFDVLAEETDSISVSGKIVYSSLKT